MLDENIIQNEQTKVKGSAITSIPEFIKDTFGQEKYNEWFNKLPLESKEIHSKLILKSNWYSLENSYIKPIQLICDMFYDGSLEGARAGGIYSANKSLTGVYKFLVKMGSPEFILNKAATISKTYYKPSEAEFVSDGKGIGRIVMTKFQGMHRIVEQRQTSWIKRAVEICGAKNVSISVTKSQLEGANHTEFTVTWE